MDEGVIYYGKVHYYIEITLQRRYEGATELIEPYQHLRDLSRYENKS